MEKFICIHGHFYQPPRENPWLEAIETQDEASPYHDWNERINAECYATNAKSRILDEKDRIVQIVNNYGRISFNFGPTLLAWMELNAPDVYKAILSADQESGKRFSGHGSALAQPYNHVILPLANRRDKYTQVLWGIRDFEHRYKRAPEGMWLPETAVDMESMDIMAESGIEFSILSPHQASRVRPLGSKEWQDVRGGHIDITKPYRLNLSCGRKMALFFYHGPLSRAVAFERLLGNGESFAQRLMGGFLGGADRPQLVHIATDGESYGHHHRFGDMALAYALHYIESRKIARLTNYGEYLHDHPPQHEVEIFENTSWSCGHGIERWRADCGCNTGAHPEWRQTWRRPLRDALDWLRDKLVLLYETQAGLLLKDPWDARNAYINVILDRSPENVDGFLNRYATHDLNEDERIRAYKLLELQRHAMLMYTSCGWFFDDISGIETIQIIQYAGRAIQLAQELSGPDPAPPFLELLEKAKSNKPDYRDGRSIYEEHVTEAMADLSKVAANYAICSLFDGYGERPDIYCYRVRDEDIRISESGKAMLIMGKARFISSITNESDPLCFGVLHLGDHNVYCGVKDDPGQDAYEALVKEVSVLFSKADITGTIRKLDKSFGDRAYSLSSLFCDERRRILGKILESTLEDAEDVYRHIYENNAPLLRFLKDKNLPPPAPLQMAAEFVLNGSLSRAFQNDAFDPELIQTLLKEAQIQGVHLDGTNLEFIFRKRLEKMAEESAKAPADLSRIKTLKKAVNLLKSLPFQVNLWTVQNVYYDMLHSIRPDMRREAGRGNENAMEWISHFDDLGEKLNMRVNRND